MLGRRVRCCFKMVSALRVVFVYRTSKCDSSDVEHFGTAHDGFNHDARILMKSN